MKKRVDSATYEKRADENNYIYFDKVRCENIVATNPHFHDSIELVLAIKGNCCIYINGKEYILEEGDCAFVDRFDVHYYRCFSGSEYYVLLVSKKYLDDSNGFNRKRLPVFLPRCEKFAEIKKLLDNVYVIWKDGNETFKRGIVNAILGFMSAQYSMTEREVKGEVQVLVNTLLYINENYEENISLEFLSKKFGYSKNYFSALFNKFAGMNLREYINQRRICEFERIRSINKEMPVYMAAQECGFTSLKTFYRAYGKYRGKS